MIGDLFPPDSGRSLPDGVRSAFWLDDGRTVSFCFIILRATGGFFSTVMALPLVPLGCDFFERPMPFIRGRPPLLCVQVLLACASGEVLAFALPHLTCVVAFTSDEPIMTARVSTDHEADGGRGGDANTGSRPPPVDDAATAPSTAATVVGLCSLSGHCDVIRFSL